MVSVSNEKKHTVVQGECMSSIAYAHGFFWDALWSHPRNAGLKKLRKSPFVLRPGDVVHIPPLSPRTASCPTGKSHTFRVKGVPELLRVVLMEADAPLANLDYILEYRGYEETGTTNENGLVEAYVPPDLQSVTLRVGLGDEERVYEVSLRTLNPTEDLDGAQARLANLGYYGGSTHGTLDDATISALRRFQQGHDLEPTGTLDAGTVAALDAAHAGAAPRSADR